MKRELIIENYGLGNAIVVLDRGKIVDLFIDPPSDSNFFPSNTFVEAKIQRKISKIGGYFVKLPNGYRGFLKSKNNYKEGETVVVLSKVFFDKDKPQTFTDNLKVISKYFILKLGESGIAFSKKISMQFDKEKLTPIIKAKINNLEDIFVICRSQIADISTVQFERELDQILEHNKLIEKEISLRKIYCDGLAKKLVLDKYDVERFRVLEEQEIFDRLGLWDKIGELNQRRYCMAHGSFLILEQTSSCFAIDVNSGSDLKVGAKELNSLACSEICQLIKVLGLGGKIIIDFLPCSKMEKRNIYDCVKVSFMDDNQNCKIWGWTNGGLFEMERERDKSPLSLLLGNN